MGRPTTLAAAAVLLAAATLVPAALLGSGEEAPAAATAGVAFRLHDTGATGSELNLGVTSNGYVFMGGWNHISRSMDDGYTWEALESRPLVNVAADRVLIVDKDTDRVLFDDTDLGCTILTWSDDYGETWTTNPVACGGGVTDHQKIATGKRRVVPEDSTGLVYENVVYVCANGLTHTPCAASFDGGYTFGPGFASMQVDMGGGSHSTTCAFQGAPVANAEGVLYQPRTQCGAALWWSEDNGVTWTHSDLPVSPSPDAPDVATTPDGSVYFFFTDADWKPHYVHSADGGRTWGTPVDVSAPGLVSSLFPVITAGDDGRIAVAYYGTTDTGSGWNGNPGAAPDHVKWHLFSGVILDADTDAATIDLVQATPDEDPVQFGCLSKLGGCLGNIADYIDIDVGPDGRAYVGYVDGCLPGCAGRGASTSDAAYVAVQTTGPRLYADA